VYAHRGPGRPGFPSALTTKGRLRKKAGTVRMKGGESRLDNGGENPRPDLTRRSRGGRRHSGAPGGGVPRKGTRHLLRGAKTKT